MKRWWFLPVAIILLMGMLILPACAKPAPEAHPQVILELLNSGEPVSLALHTGLTDLLNKHHTWIRASVTEVGGDEDALIQAVDKDPTTLFVPFAWNYYGAKHGVAPWTEMYPDVRIIGSMIFQTMNMMSNNPNVRTLDDLVGKKVVGLTGSVTTKMLETMLEIKGTRGQVDIEMQGYGAQFDSFRDRLTVNVLDQVLIDQKTNSGHIGGFLEEAVFALKGEVYPVEWPPELIKQASDTLGMAYLPVEIPAGTLEKQDRAWHGQSHGGYMCLCTWAQANEEVIYEVTKMLVERLSELEDYHPYGAFVTLENLIANMPIDSESEVHPGALRYYKEAGIWQTWPGPWSKR